MSDTELELLDQKQTPAGDTPLPVNFIEVGEVRPGDLKVYIRQDVYRKVEAFAAADTSREVGGILFGDYAEEMGGTHVIISDFIEAKFTDASASTLTFTHETWEYVHREHERRFADKKIVGWQHTHPNYGIFLSNYDLFIQQNFFNLPFQTAYVVDPIQNLRGFFQNVGERTERLNGFYIYDEVGKPVKVEQAKRPSAGKPAARAPKILTLLVCLLLACTVALAVFAYTLNEKHGEQAAAQRELENRLAEQERQTVANGALREALSDVAASEEKIGALTERANRSEAQLAALCAQAEELRERVEALEAQSVLPAGALVLVPYSVEPGDTLIAVCKRAGVDYYENEALIRAVNGIADPDRISAGQVLYLPVGIR